MSTSSPPINIDDGDIDDILYQPVDLWIHQKNEPDYQAGTHSRGFTNAYAEFKFNGLCRSHPVCPERPKH